MGSVKPQFATVSFKVTKGDSVKIFYETTPPQVGLIERIPLEYSQRGNYYDSYTNETISYTYLNFAKYYECLRWYGTALDVYAFEYPVEDCSDAPQCDVNSSFEPPQFIVKEITPADYSKLDLCDKLSKTSGVVDIGGFFFPLFNKPEWEIINELVDDYNLDVCYNSSTNQWQYSIDDGTIFLNTVLGVCEQNLEGFEVIKSFNDLSRISGDDVCKALEDFELHYDYYALGHESYNYVLYDILDLHESIHKERFISLFKQTMNSISEDNSFNIEIPFKDLFTYMQLRCEDNPDYVTTKNKWKNLFNKILESFLKELERKYINQKNDPQNEYKTHNDNRIEYLIKQYIEVLKAQHPELNCK